MQIIDGLNFGSMRRQNFTIVWLRVNSSLALLIDRIRKREAIMHLHVSAKSACRARETPTLRLFKAGHAVFAPSNTSRGCVTVV